MDVCFSWQLFYKSEVRFGLRVFFFAKKMNHMCQADFSREVWHMVFDAYGKTIRSGLGQAG